VAVISPSVLSEDLREGIETVCRPYKKTVLYLRFEELAKIFKESEVQSEFDGA
jgi:hypothetical protein